MKRYLLFAGSDYYPGRWDDFVCSGDSIEELVQKIEYDFYDPTKYIEEIKSRVHKKPDRIKEDEKEIERQKGLAGRPHNLRVGDREWIDWIEIIDLETEVVCWNDSMLKGKDEV